MVLPRTRRIQLPEVLLLALLASPLALVALRNLRRDVILVATAGILPLAYAMFRQAPVYNGFRHFLFVLPPLVAVGAATGAALHDLALRLSRPLAHVGLVIAALLVTKTATEMWRLHPYQYIHYNDLAGGIRGATGRYELDYYCHSYAEAVRALDAHLKSEPVNREDEPVVRVFADDHPFSSTPWFPDHWERVDDPESADYVISRDPAVGGETLLTVRRLGVDLNYVKRGGA